MTKSWQKHNANVFTQTHQPNMGLADYLQEGRRFPYSDRRKLTPAGGHLRKHGMVYRHNSAHGATFSPMQFPLVLPLKYKAISPEAKAISGTGSTVLLSSTDIVFNAGQPIRSGVRCEISIAWPVLLENRIRLQLVLQSLITRSEGQVVMARVSKYEFQTQVPGSNIFE